ncbi:MAG: HAD-IIIC family phosphatase [Chitinivibrionales bacterium]|nr:HAD-IIIC family phosphatase [Chitinivibrionales bacterium]
MKIGICGNIFLDPLAVELDTLLPRETFIVGRPGSFHAELTEPFGDFRELDVCIIALDWRELTRDLYRTSPLDDFKEIAANFRAACDSIKNSIEKYRTVCSAKLLLFPPISDCRGPAGFIDRLLQPSPFELFCKCQNIFNDLCRTLTDVYPVDCEQVAGQIGKDNIYNPPQWYRERQPFTKAFTHAIAVHIAAIYTQIQKYSLKCLALDLDDTLWGGIVGETGTDNLVLGEQGLGPAYQDFQAEILRLYKQGVILAVCSKNNTCDALEVIERHPAMLIRPNMISCFRINWEDKPKNIIEIAQELGIGLDAIMFVDDNPAERELMRASLPEVEILELPKDPSYYAQTLRNCTRFWPLQITKDDAAKGSFFSQEKLRKQAHRLSANKTAYFLNVNITATIAPNSPESLPRITQLFNKTNQFNLTTIRYTQTELEEILKDPASHLIYMALSDNFGDYGIIAAALIRKDTIVAFVMSCRSFGKQAEKAFLIYLLNFLKKRGRHEVWGHYIPSPKNEMTKDFYGSNGFTLETITETERRWRFDLNNPIQAYPDWITIKAAP